MVHTETSNQLSFQQAFPLENDIQFFDQPPIIYDFNTELGNTPLHTITSPEILSLRREDLLFGQQIDSFHRNSPHDKEKMHLLPHAGFNIHTQINQLQTDIQEGLSSHINPTEIVQQWDRKANADIYGFVLEYLKGQAFLPFKNSLGWYQGQWRLMPNQYGTGKPIIDLLKPSERNGAVVESIHKLEDFLLRAPQGSIAIRTSPPGASGLYDDVGREIVYKDTQTQIYQKGAEGIINGYTIRTDENVMDWRENKKLLEELGASFPPDFDTYQNEDRLSALTRLNIFLLPNAGTGVKDIVKKIQTLSHDRAFGNTSFDSILDGIDNVDEILRIDKLAGDYIERFLRFTSKSVSLAQEQIQREGKIPNELIEQLQIALGITILELMEAYKDVEYKPAEQAEIHVMKNVSANFDRVRITTHEQMSQSLTELQKLAGCAGGGTGGQGSLELSVPSVLGPRSATLKELTVNNIDLNTVKEIRCPECNQTHTYRASEAQSQGQLKCKTDGCGNKTSCWEPFFSNN